MHGDLGVVIGVVMGIGCVAQRTVNTEWQGVLFGRSGLILCNAPVSPSPERGVRLACAPVVDTTHSPRLFDLAYLPHTMGLAEGIRALRAHSSIGESPRLITGLFLVRSQVGPQVSKTNPYRSGDSLPTASPESPSKDQTRVHAQAWNRSNVEREHPRTHCWSRGIIGAR